MSAHFVHELTSKEHVTLMSELAAQLRAIRENQKDLFKLINSPNIPEHKISMQRIFDFNEKRAMELDALYRKLDRDVMHFDQNHTMVFLPKL